MTVTSRTSANLHGFHGGTGEAGQHRANRRPKSQVKVSSAGSVSSGQRRFHPNDIRVFFQSSKRFRGSERCVPDHGH
jgi:hypothetical protein